jgi:hypothetical protein
MAEEKGGILNMPMVFVPCNKFCETIHTPLSVISHVTLQISVCEGPKNSDTRHLSGIRRDRKSHTFRSGEITAMVFACHNACSERLILPMREIRVNIFLLFFFLPEYSESTALCG